MAYKMYIVKSRLYTYFIGANNVHNAVEFLLSDFFYRCKDTTDLESDPVYSADMSAMSLGVVCRQSVKSPLTD